MKIKNVCLLNSSSIPESAVIPFTPTSGSAYEGYGGCYYYKKGSKVHIHLGLEGIANEQINPIFTMPEGFRPRTSVFNTGIGNNYLTISGINVMETGLIRVAVPSGGYVGADMEYDVFS